MDGQFQPGWFTDPTGRHERRWWSGECWTGHVQDGGQQLFDMQGIPAGWQPDALGRHQFRYWDGAQWTDQVKD